MVYSWFDSCLDFRLVGYGLVCCIYGFAFVFVLKVFVCIMFAFAID